MQYLVLILALLIEQKFSDQYDNLDLSDEQRKVINHWINYGINRSEVTNVKACKNPIILAGLVNQDISLLSPLLLLY